MSHTPSRSDTALSALLDQLDRTAIWTVSEAGEFDYISEGFEDIWGIPLDEIRGDPDRLLKTIHPDDRDHVRSLIEDPIAEASEVEYEGRVVRPDGEIRWLKNQQVPVRDMGQTYIIGISTDITEQKRREQELNVLNRILRHDIRNDMTVVLGWMELLEDHVDDEGQEYLRKILSSGEHIVELTDLAREYVELIVEGDDMAVQPIPLDSMLLTEIDIRREMFPDAEFVVRGDVPAVEVLANDMLSSVFRNPLNNAVQHNDKQDPRVTVSVVVDEPDVVVTIADNGPGIPEDQKESIFGDQQKGIDSSGTGMGLYLTKTLVDNFGGEIRATDNDPTGAVFEIRLPKADPTPIST